MNSLHRAILITMSLAGGLCAAEAFDQQAFNQDPAAYLAISDPTRVDQTAAVGKDVQVLMPGGRVNLQIAAQATATLAVQAPAGAPVSWTTTSGSFSNGNTSITVRANEQGRAAVVFTGTTSGTANIVVGCPLASGQVRFTVTVN